jgi:hypothetical protein
MNRGMTKEEFLNCKTFLYNGQRRYIRDGGVFDASGEQVIYYPSTLEDYWTFCQRDITAFDPVQEAREILEQAGYVISTYEPKPGDIVVTDQDEYYYRDAFNNFTYMGRKGAPGSGSQSRPGPGRTFKLVTTLEELCNK